MRKLYATLLGTLLLLCAHAQYTTLATPSNPGVLQTSGPGYLEYRLTTTTPIEQAGAVWKNAQYDLNANFTFQASLNFGIYSETNLDNTKPYSLPGDPYPAPFDYRTGADGIAFVMAPAPYLGQFGEEIGYGTTPAGGVYAPNNSLAVEMDTWQNVWPAHDGWRDHHDPDGNHIAMMSKGQTIHGTPDELVAPISLPSDLEDGQWHDVRIDWVAATHTLTLTSTSGFAFTVTYSLTPAQMTSVFGGANMINVGFTAATGTAANEHRVRWITPPPPPPSCGQLKTYTIGGWGATPHGNNPGVYLHDNFAAAFPSGLTVGRIPDYHATFTTAQAITDYLPAGGPSVKLTQNYLNPATTSLKNTVVSQLIGVTLAVGFDAYDPNFGQGGTTLGDMIIASGPFMGWTVNAFLAEANKILGGGSSSYTLAQVNSTATAINENYDGGTVDNGYLECPTTSVARMIPAPVVSEELTNRSLMTVYPNPSRGQLQVNLDKDINGEVMIVNARGVIVERRKVSGAQNLSFDLKRYGVGMYMVKVLDGSNIQTTKVLVQD